MAKIIFEVEEKETKKKFADKCFRYGLTQKTVLTNFITDWSSQKFVEFRIVEKKK